MANKLKRALSILLMVCLLLTFAAPAVLAEESAAGAGTEETRVVTYDFDLGVSTTLPGFSMKSLANPHVETGKAVSDAISDYYADGKLNWKVEALATGLDPKNVMFRSAPQGWRIPAADGQWLALRIKNPGAGTYDLSLKRGMSNKSSMGAVYILDGNTTDIPAALSAGKPISEVNYQYDDDATVPIGKYTFGDAEEYIVVFTCNNRFYLSSLTMTSVQDEGSEIEQNVYDFALADKATGIYTVPEDAEYVDVKDKLEDIASRYAEGKLNWNYQGISSDLSPEGVLPEKTVRMYPETGIRLYSNEGGWIAFKIKSPGEGIRTLTLNHAISANGAKATVYILPADTTDIAKTIDPSNRVGKVNFHNTDAAEGLQGGISTIVGSYRFDTAEEYILVIEATNHTPFNDHRAYLFFSSLVITEGYIDKPEEEGAKINPIKISSDVVNVGDAQSAGMSAEINGEDYYFSPIKGGKMYVYNLKTMQMIDEVDTGVNYPNGAAIGKDGIVWLGGTNKNLFRYDPFTGVGTTVASFAIGPLSSTSGLYDLSIGDDGCLYFGTIKPAHIVKYDPVTRQYTDYGCMDANANRVSTVVYKDGIIYACVEGNNIHNFIKMDPATGTILETLDISEKVGAVDYVNKIGVLNENLLIVGANRLENMIAIDISGETMAFKDIGVETGMNNTVSDPKDGKIYFVAYKNGLCEYDIATGKAKVVEGLEAASIGFRFTNNTWVSVDHPDLPGESLFTFSSSGAVPVFYNLETKKVVKIESLTNGYGAGQIIRGFVSTSDGSNQIYIGAFNTKNATVFDVNTGTFTKHYITTGQTDSQIIYKDKLYAGNYTSARLVEVDVDGKNATVLFNLGIEPFMQDRIHTLTAGENKIFVGTTPGKFLHSGYLVWYDLETKRTYVAVEPDKAVYAEADDQTKWYDAKTNALCDFDADDDGVNEYQGFKGIVSEQTINCIVYHDGLIYGTTSTSGGTGSTVLSNLSAVLFVYDVANMELLATYDLCEAIDGLVSPITFVAGIAADPDVDTNGKFWGMVSETLFSYTFDKETKTFNVREELSFGKTEYNGGASRQWFPRNFQFKDGYLYTSFYPDGGFRKVNLSNPLDNQRIMGDNPLWYVIAEDGNLYYSCNDSALNVLPLDVTDEDWAKAEAVDALIAAIGSPVTVDSDAAVKAARSAYNDLSWALRALVQNYTALEEAESDLTEAKIDTIGEVTLEDAALIGAIRAEYEELTTTQKGYVKNYDTLLEAENALADLNAAADKAAVDNVEKLIAAIGEVTKDSGDAIKAARNAYDALTDAQKKKVTSVKVLTDAEAAYDELTRDPSNPGTGDYTQVALLICVALISAMAIAAIPVMRKKA
jgi:(2Fe-2S) ferredoxin